MRSLFALVMILLSVAPGFAQESKAKECARIDDTLRRLNCYDAIFKSGVESKPSMSPTATMNFIDFLADFDDLSGKKVQVRGFGLMMADSLLLYQEMGSMNGAFVNIERLSRDDRRELLRRCGSGCNVTVSGVAAKVMMQKGLIAQSITFAL